MSIVYDGQIVQEDGIYSYKGHKNPSDDIGCNPTKKEREGQILLKDFPAPNLGCCPHGVQWKLKETLDLS